MRVDERIARNAITPEAEPHIVPDQRLCARCQGRPCVSCCPGHLYELVAETGEMRVELAGCLECGTCMLVCPSGALRWRQPAGGCGIRYRFG